MLSCKKAAVLISQDIDDELSAIGKLKLRCHLFICQVCRTLRKQLQLQRLAAKTAAEQEHLIDPAAGRLADESRERIKAALREKKKPPSL